MVSPYSAPLHIQLSTSIMEVVDHQIHYRLHWFISISLHGITSYMRHFLQPFFNLDLTKQHSGIVMTSLRYKTSYPFTQT